MTGIARDQAVGAKDPSTVSAKANANWKSLKTSVTQ